MNIGVFGKNKEKLIETAKAKGIEINDFDSDLIISYGGDGTFLLAECKFPEIPKLLIRENNICKLCVKEDLEDALEIFKKGRYKIDEINKVEVEFNGKILNATNEIILHNADPRHAIRYEVEIDGKKIHNHDVIGDGIVLSTQLGATGYYRSITDSIFFTGIGLAFNNSTEPYDHMVLNENSIIKIKIKRGPAIIFADSQKDGFDLNEGNEITIRKSDLKTRIVRFLN